MKRHLTLVLLAAVALFAACSHDKGPDAGEVAGKTAKIYYDYLLKGKYVEFVDGFYRPEKIPDHYHAQLVENAKMFMAQQQEEHRGIARVDVVSVSADTARHVADVFMAISYKDSVKEQIAVPMIQKKGIWLMR